MELAFKERATAAFGGLGARYDTPARGAATAGRRQARTPRQLAGS